MTSLPWMSSQARTQRSQRMQASWLTAITGLEKSSPRPRPRGRSSWLTPYRCTRTSSSLSAVVVSLGSSSGGGWSTSSSRVSMARWRSTESVFVLTSMPSSHGRTQAGASTRAPMSTTQTRHTPTGSYRSSWHRTGISMPMPFAASQIVVPSATVTSRPSIVRVTVRGSADAGLVIATIGHILLDWVQLRMYPFPADPVLVALVDERADGVADGLLVQQRQTGRLLGVVVPERGHDALVLTL